ncbi:MAG: hypothetical protein HY286_12065 [Planctomycetes bacterium]|nr:hypothetical protein [Planctomycetota bacterium]
MVILPATMLAVLVNSCVVAAVAVGVAAGIVIHETVISEDTIESEIKLAPDVVFENAKEELKSVSTESVAIKPDIRTVEGKYDDCHITIVVNTADTNRSYLRVTARKFAFPKLETARYILHRIQDRLAKL